MRRSRTNDTQSLNPNPTFSSSSPLFHPVEPQDVTVPHHTFETPAPRRVRLTTASSTEDNKSPAASHAKMSTVPLPRSAHHAGVGNFGIFGRGVEKKENTLPAPLPGGSVLYSSGCVRSPQKSTAPDGQNGLIQNAPTHQSHRTGSTCLQHSVPCYSADPTNMPSCEFISRPLHPPSAPLQRSAEPSAPAPTARSIVVPLGYAASRPRTKERAPFGRITQAKELPPTIVLRPSIGVPELGDDASHSAPTDALEHTTTSVAAEGGSETVPFEPAAFPPEDLRRIFNQYMEAQFQSGDFSTLPSLDAQREVLQKVLDHQFLVHSEQLAQKGIKVKDKIRWFFLREAARLRKVERRVFHLSRQRYITETLDWDTVLPYYPQGRIPFAVQFALSPSVRRKIEQRTWAALIEEATLNGFRTITDGADDSDRHVGVGLTVDGNDRLNGRWRTYPPNAMPVTRRLPHSSVRGRQRLDSVPCEEKKMLALLSCERQALLLDDLWREGMLLDGSSSAYSPYINPVLQRQPNEKKPSVVARVFVSTLPHSVQTAESAEFLTSLRPESPLPYSEDRWQRMSAHNNTNRTSMNNSFGSIDSPVRSIGTPPPSFELEVNDGAGADACATAAAVAAGGGGGGGVGGGGVGDSPQLLPLKEKTTSMREAIDVVARFRARETPPHPLLTGLYPFITAEDVNGVIHLFFNPDTPPAPDFFMQWICHSFHPRLPTIEGPNTLRVPEFVRTSLSLADISLDSLKKTSSVVRDSGYSHVRSSTPLEMAGVAWSATVPQDTPRWSDDEEVEPLALPAPETETQETVERRRSSNSTQAASEGQRQYFIPETPVHGGDASASPPAPRPLALHITESQLAWLCSLLHVNSTCGGLPQLQELHCSFSKAALLKGSTLLSCWLWVKSILMAREDFYALNITEREDESDVHQYGSTERLLDDSDRGSPNSWLSPPLERLSSEAFAEIGGFHGLRQDNSNNNTNISSSPLMVQLSQDMEERQEALFAAKVGAFNGLHCIPRVQILRLINETPIDVLRSVLGRRNMRCVSESQELASSLTRIFSNSNTASAAVGAGGDRADEMPLWQLREFYYVAERVARPSRNLHMRPREEPQRTLVQLSHKRLPSLEVLWLDVPRLIGLLIPSPLPWLRELHLIVDTHFKSSALKGVEDLASLEILHIEKASIDTFGFIGDSQSLTELLMHNCRFSASTSPRPLQGIERAPALTYLSLAYAHDLRYVDHLSTNRVLRKLVLTRCNTISSASIMGLEKIPTLEVLCLEYTRVSQMSVFAQTKSLKVLRLDGCKRVLRSSIVGLERNASLVELSLCNTNVITVSNLAGGGAALRILDLSDCLHIDVDGLQGLQALPRLEVLSLSNTRVTSVSFLQDCVTLTTLVMEGCVSLEPQGLVGLEKAPKLQRVIANYCRSLTHVGHMGRSRTLVALSLVDVDALQDAGLVGIQNCRTLEYLNLSGTGVEDVRFLSRGCEAVKVLDLSRCSRLTNTGIRHLEFLPRLQELSLQFDEQVTDVNHLARSFTLQRLDCLGSGVGKNPAGRADLRYVDIHHYY